MIRLFENDTVQIQPDGEEMVQIEGLLREEGIWVKLTNAPHQFVVGSASSVQLYEYAHREGTVAVDLVWEYQVGPGEEDIRITQLDFSHELNVIEFFENSQNLHFYQLQGESLKSFNLSPFNLSSVIGMKYVLSIDAVLMATNFTVEKFIINKLFSEPSVVCVKEFYLEQENDENEFLYFTSELIKLQFSRLVCMYDQMYLNYHVSPGVHTNLQKFFNFMNYTPYIISLIGMDNNWKQQEILPLTSIQINDNELLSMSRIGKLTFDNIFINIINLGVLAIKQTHQLSFSKCYLNSSKASSAGPIRIDQIIIQDTDHIQFENCFV